MNDIVFEIVVLLGLCIYLVLDFLFYKKVFKILTKLEKRVKCLESENKENDW